MATLKRTPIRKVRSKPRPGRVKGKAMESLRRQVFERDGYRCQHVTQHGLAFVKCMDIVTWETGHMAHIRNRRMWGDSLDNCTTKCAHHHLAVEHAYGPSGIKPCNPKSVDTD